MRVLTSIACLLVAIGFTMALPTGKAIVFVTRPLPRLTARSHSAPRESGGAAGRLCYDRIAT